MRRPPHRLDYEAFWRLCEEAGFLLFDAVLDAQHFGVAQRRPRLLAVGLNRERYPDEPFCFPEPPLLVERRGRMDRVVTERDVQRAMHDPPQTTRARLRGEFIRHAKQHRRDYTVDWVHLKLNDQAQRTVLCKDPFRSRDDRVDQLIAHM